MNHFRILKEVNGVKYNVPLSAIEKVMDKHCRGIENNKKFIQSAIYRIHNAAIFFNYPMKLYANRQQYPVKYWSEHLKVLKTLQVYEQNDIAFIPPIQFITDVRIRKNMTPDNIDYISELISLIGKKLPVFFWFIHLPVFLQIIILNDIYNKYRRNCKKVEEKGKYLFSLLKTVCLDKANYHTIVWHSKFITEFRYAIHQKNSVFYYLSFPVFTSLRLETPSVILWDNIQCTVNYLAKLSKVSHDRYANTLDILHSFMSRTPGSLWVEFPTFSFSENIGKRNQSLFPEYPPFIMEDFKNVTIKNKLTASIKKSTKIA